GSNIGAEANQGKPRSSNESGDVPTFKCCGCGEKLPDMLRMCKDCFDRGCEFPREQCSVCHIRFSSTKSGSRAQYLKKSPDMMSRYYRKSPSR
ncbi:unnamed protein product, partial [Pylaiella littoralis]